jgi:hypothetical protein
MLYVNMLKRQYYSWVLIHTPSSEDFPRKPQPMHVSGQLAEHIWYASALPGVCVYGMCMYICVYVLVCMYVCISMYVCMYVYVCI